MERWPHHFPGGSLFRRGPSSPRYYLGEALYEDGLIIVYEGERRSTGSPCLIWEFYPLHLCFRWGPAVKPRPGMEKAFGEAREWFLSQCEILRSFRDAACILEYWDSFESNGSLFLITEYPKGQTLRQKVERSGPMDLDDTNFDCFAMDLASILVVSCPEKGSVLRTLTPDTVLITEDGDWKLLDVHQAMPNTSTYFPLTTRTPYTPVEQYTTGGQGPWTDIYAMGAVLYYCATGREPPTAAARLEGAELPPLNSPLGQAITAAMSLFPKDRLTSMIDLMV